MFPFYVIFAQSIAAKRVQKCEFSKQTIPSYITVTNIFEIVKEINKYALAKNTLNLAHVQTCICHLCFSRHFNDSNYVIALKINHVL